LRRVLAGEYLEDRLSKEGIEYVVDICSDVSSIDRVLSLAESYPNTQKLWFDRQIEMASIYSNIRRYA